MLWPAAVAASEPTEMTDGPDRRDCPTLAIPFEPGAAALIRLGVELVLEAYARDPDATLVRLAEVAARGDEPFRIPAELMVSDDGLSARQEAPT